MLQCDRIPLKGAPYRNVNCARMPDEVQIAVQRWFNETVLSRRWATFVVLGLAFFCFGAGTLNLFVLLRANASLIAEHGWQAILDGGLRQLLELLLTGYASVAAYVVLKACEFALVRRIVKPYEQR